MCERLNWIRNGMTFGVCVLSNITDLDTCYRMGNNRTEWWPGTTWSDAFILSPQECTGVCVGGYRPPEISNEVQWKMSLKSLLTNIFLFDRNNVFDFSILRWLVWVSIIVTSVTHVSMKQVASRRVRLFFHTINTITHVVEYDWLRLGHFKFLHLIFFLCRAMWWWNRLLFTFSIGWSDVCQWWLSTVDTNWVFSKWSHSKHLYTSRRNLDSKINWCSHLHNVWNFNFRFVFLKLLVWTKENDICFVQKSKCVCWSKHNTITICHVSTSTRIFE